MKTLIKFLEPYEKKWSKKIEKKGHTVTVSGFVGTGSTTIAKMLAREMNIVYFYPPAVFRERSKDKGTRLAEEVGNSTREENYSIEKETLEAAMKGNVVIDSRMAGYVAGGYANFKIFVECEERLRIERIAARDGISSQEAEKEIKDRDSLVVTKLSRIYNVDIADTSIYDMVVDNSGSLEELEKKVKEIVNRIRVFG